MSGSPTPVQQLVSPPPEPEWLRERIDKLCEWERGSASAGERAAAEWLAGELERAGARPQVEAEPGANGTYWWPLGLLAFAGVLGGVATLSGGRWGRLAGGALGAGACALAADEMPPNSRRFRRILPNRTAHQVIAELGSPDAERTVVVMAHHDAAHSAFFFNPAITETIARHAPGALEHNDTSPPLMWPVVAAPGVVAAGAALGSKALTAVGTALSAATVGFMANIGASQVVPGANDNCTAVVAQLALAEAFAERPLENTRIVFFSSSEEALCEGVHMFMERHGHEYPVDSTFFFCIDTIGSPTLTVLRGEGMLNMREYPAASLDLIDSTAAELGIELVPNLRLRNATDAVVPLARGYQCVSLCSVNELKNPSNYHWPTDTPDRVNYDTVRDGVRLAEAVIRRLDESWLAARD